MKVGSRWVAMRRVAKSHLKRLTRHLHCTSTPPPSHLIRPSKGILRCLSPDFAMTPSSTTTTSNAPHALRDSSLSHQNVPLNNTSFNVHTLRPTLTAPPPTRDDPRDNTMPHHDDPLAMLHRRMMNADPTNEFMYQLPIKDQGSEPIEWVVFCADCVVVHTPHSTGFCACTQ